MPAPRARTILPWRRPDSPRLPLTFSHRLPIRHRPTTISTKRLYATTTTTTTPHTDTPTTTHKATRPSHAQTLPPTSPNSIDIPPPRQTPHLPTPRLKGVLPTLRNLFHPKYRPPTSITPTHLRHLTPTRKPKPHHRPRPPLDPQTRHLRLQSRARRSNLRSGLAALARRRARLDAAMRTRRARHAAARDRLLRAPPPESATLTAPSVPVGMRPARGRLPDPDARERLEGKMARVRRGQEVKAERTRDHLHSLYMRARGFITDEAGLERAIEGEFGVPEAPRTWGVGMGGSFWDEEGKRPRGVGDLLVEREREGEGGEVVRRRLRALGEEFTGGKM